MESQSVLSVAHMLDLSPNCSTRPLEVVVEHQGTWTDSNTKQVGWSAGPCCAIGKITTLVMVSNICHVPTRKFGEHCSTHFDKVRICFNWVGEKPPTKLFFVEKMCVLFSKSSESSYQPNKISFSAKMRRNLVTGHQDYVIYIDFFRQLEIHQPKPTQMCDWKCSGLGSGRSKGKREHGLGEPNFVRPPKTEMMRFLRGLFCREIGRAHV